MNTADDVRIQRYLDGEMGEDEQQDFEIKLLQTESLREKVEEYRWIAKGIHYYGEKEAWLKIQALEAEAEAETDAVEEKAEKKPVMTNWLYLGIAASVLLFLFAFPMYWQQDELRYARMFDQNFEAYQALGGPTRSATDEKTTFVLPEAFEAYHEKQYPQAIELFKQASEQEDKPYIWLYLGNAYLSIDQEKEAISALQHVLEYDLDENTRNRTYWYLGLAHLKLNQRKEAVQNFERLQNNEEYGPKAKKIIESIH